MLNDSDLVQNFVDRGSDDAFRALVERHAGMVHGVALRAVRDRHLAEDVTQAVFVILARKASGLRQGIIVAGWLYRTTRFVAMEALRAERRRQQHREDFALMDTSSSTSSTWGQLTPLLDEVLCRLGAKDRNAIVLRFLEERSFADMAVAIGTTEAGAKMRVSRALEKLRSAFARRGVAIPAAALLATLSEHSASAAPPALSANVAAAALAQNAAANSSMAVLVKSTLKLIAWQKVKTATVFCAIGLCFAGGALLVGERARQPVREPAFSTGSLDPISGEWEGTFARRGEGGPETVEPVRLSVRTSQAGHSCEIDMRALDAAGRVSSSYRFSHVLNPSGTSITTVDDPQVARMSGEGTISESFADAQSTEWRLTFRTPQANGSYSECRMVRKGETLTTTRSDWVTGPQGLFELKTELKLRRPSRGKSVP